MRVALTWIVILPCSLIGRSFATSRSCAPELQCYSGVEPESSIDRSLLQSAARRFRAELAQEDRGGIRLDEEPPYGSREEDQAFRDDVVEDHDIEIEKKINGETDANDGVPDRGEAYEEDMDFAMDDYRGGSAQRLCWIPPALDDYGNVINTSHLHVWAPINHQCPPQCPFTQGLPEDRCYKACVTADQCRLLHPFRVFGDNISKHCTATCGLNPEDFVEGCAVCASAGICKKCSFWRTVVKGGRECKDYWQYMWIALSRLAWLLFLLFLIWLVYLQYRPIMSPGLLERAALHRNLTSPWRLDIMQPGNRVKVRRHTLLAKTHEENVSGMGIALYFRWLRFVTLMAGMFFPILYLTFHISLEVQVVEYAGANARRRLDDIFGFSWSGRDPGLPPDQPQGPQRLLTVAVVTEPERCRYRNLDPANNGRQDKFPAILPAADTVNHQLAGLLQANETVDKPHLRVFKQVKLGLNPSLKVKLKAKSKMPIDHHIEPLDVPAGTFALFPVRMFLSLALTYLLLTCSSLAYGRHQSRFAERWRAQHSSHRDFAIFVSGLPAAATDPVQMQTFFQSLLDASAKDAQSELPASELQVVGVSIGYDVGFCERDLPFWYAMLIEKIESNLLQSLTDDDEFAISRRESQKFAIPPRDADKLEAVLPSRFNLFARFARFLMRKGESTAYENWDTKARRALESMTCSGQAYIVVSSSSARDRLLALTAEQLRWRSDGQESAGDLLTLSQCTVEPPSVLWEAHGHVPSKRLMATNLCLLVLTVLGWAISFAPYAYYQIAAKAVPGRELAASADFVLGVLIAFGNNLVCLMIDVTTHHFGILDKERLDMMTMGLIYIATVANTFLDIGIILVALRGLSLDLAVHGTLDQSHYDRVLAHELFGLLVPGYLITPYLTAPLLEDIVPAFAKKRLIRSSSGMDRVFAERKYMRPSFDLSWHYSDLLTNLTVCLPLLMFGTHHIYAIVLCLLCCYCLTYVIDHFRLLRCTTRTWQCTSQLDYAFSYLWSVPIGFVGTIALHWAIEADLIQPRRKWEKWFQLLFLVTHCACYCALNRWLRAGALTKAEIDDDNMSYEAMRRLHWLDLRFYDYFNTNPVQVLRSWLLPELEAEKERAPFVLGKEHLMLLDPVIAQRSDIREAILMRMDAAEEKAKPGNMQRHHIT